MMPTPLRERKGALVSLHLTAVALGMLAVVCGSVWSAARALRGG